ncbi:transcription regulator gal80 [Xylographa soralifera]|nr:transcription regulator gal80 [Xylographa soralifera]
MTRIRIGLIGLSTTSTGTNWAVQAHLPYLQSPQGQKHYEIVALCNSSIASCHKSIQQYDLPASTKAYDSAADLARDPDVDLVVNVTHVMKHYELVAPVVQAGKNVFTELPLASTTSQMRELLQTAQEKKVSTVFGIQGQTSPVTKLLRDVIASDKIGKVLSTTWTGSAMFLGKKPLAIGGKAFMERKTGGNILTVVFLHCKPLLSHPLPSESNRDSSQESGGLATSPAIAINLILATLGEVDTFQSILGNQRPTVEIMDPQQGGKIVETISKDTPDQVLLQGRLDSGALLSYHLRGGDPFPDEKGLMWSIYGEKGEIQITHPSWMLDIRHDGFSIKLHEFGQKDAQDLELAVDDMSGLPHPAQNVGRIYEAYAKGEAGSYPDWELGMKRHELIDEMWRRSDGETPFGEPVVET